MNENQDYDKRTREDQDNLEVKKVQAKYETVENYLEEPEKRYSYSKIICQNTYKIQQQSHNRI